MIPMLKTLKNFRQLILGILIGAVIFTTLSVLAVEFNITPNPFRITVNNKDVSIEGYNIDGSTYFKLRDIGDAVGFDVGFADDTVAISTNGVGEVDNTVATPAPVGESKYEIPVVTADSPLYSTTVDGLEMVLYNGQYTVEKDTIIKKLKGMGYEYPNDYFFTKDKLYLRGLPVDIEIFSGILTVDENNQHILVNYYYSTILPWIETLTTP